MRCKLVLFLTLLLLPLTAARTTAAEVDEPASTTQRDRPLHLEQRYADLPDPICEALQ